jgi:hypothetical protein
MHPLKLTEKAGDFKPKERNGVDSGCRFGKNRNDRQVNSSGGKSVRRTCIVMVAIVLLAFGTAPAFVGASPPAGPAYRTIHTFSLKSAQEEKQLISTLGELNGVLAKLGFSKVRYRLWKIQGAAEGLSGYMYESTWPSLEVYDRVHKQAAYRKVLEKNLPFLREVLKNEIYDKLVELDIK